MADANLRILITAVTEDVKKSLADLKNEFAKLADAVKAINTGDSSQIAAAMEALGDAVSQTSTALDQNTNAANKNSEANQHAADAANKHAEAHKAAHSVFGQTLEQLKRMGEAIEHVASVVKLLSGGFLAFEAIGMVKEIADTAARANTLALSMETVGNNAGYTTKELRDTDKEVQKLGITAESSRQSITKLLQSGLSLNFAQPLARAAQDLAVISGLNSSDTFSRLVDNIQQMDTLGLRFMGIIIDREQVMARAQQELGTAITGNLAKTVLANAVLAESAKLTGLYEVAMTSAGKALTSMPRYVENFKDALGQSLQPAYLQLILGTQEVLKALTELIEAFHEAPVNAELFGESMSDGSGQLTGLAQAIKELADHIKEFIEYLAQHTGAIKEFFSILGDVAKISALVLGFSSLRNIFLALVPSVEGATAAGLFLGQMLTKWGPITGIVIAGLRGIVTILTRLVSGPIGWALTAFTALQIVMGLFGSKSKDAAKEGAQSADELVASYDSALKKLEQLQKQSVAAQNALRIASNKQAAAAGKGPDEQAKAKAEADAAKKIADDLKKQYEAQIKVVNDLQNQLKYSKELADRPDLKKHIEEETKAHAANAAAIQAEIDRLNALDEALRAAGSSYSKYATGVSQQTNILAGAVDRALAGLGKVEGENINAQIAETLSIFEKEAASVNTDQGLGTLRASSKSIIKEVGKTGIDVSHAVDAAITATEERVRKANFEGANGGAQALTQIRENLRREGEELRNKLLADAETKKGAAQQQELIDKAFLDRGLLNLETYYGTKIKLEKEAAEASIKARQADQANLLKSIAIEPDQNEKAKLQSKYDLEQKRINTALDQAALATLRDQIALETTRLNLLREVDKIKSTYNSKTGNEELAIEQESNAALQAQIEKYSQLSGVERDEAIAIAKKSAELDKQDKLLDLQLQKMQREHSLASSLLDLEESRIQGEIDHGNLTSVEGDRAQNELIRQRIDQLGTEIEKYRAVRDAAAAANDTTKANEMAQKIVETAKAAQDLANKWKDVADEIRKGFTDAITSNLEAMLNGTKSFKDGIKGIFKDIQGTINHQIAKDFAESITKSMKGDGDGNDLFSWLGSLLGGSGAKPKVPGLKPGEDKLPNVKAKPEEVLAESTAQIKNRLDELVKAYQQNVQQLQNSFMELEKQANDLADAFAKAHPSTLPSTSSNVRSGRNPGDFGSDTFNVRGFRNNNPGNLQAGTGFEGETGSDGRYGVYDTAENGIRALAKNLIAAQDKHQRDTVKDIISAYAPAKENGQASTDAYIKDVADKLGVSADQKLDLHDKATLQKFTEAIIQHENGKQPYDAQTIDNAVNRALGRPTQQITDANPLPVRIAQEGHVRNEHTSPEEKASVGPATQLPGTNGAAGLTTGTDEREVTYDRAGHRIVSPRVASDTPVNGEDSFDRARDRAVFGGPVPTSSVDAKAQQNQQQTAEATQQTAQATQRVATAAQQTATATQQQVSDDRTSESTDQKTSQSTETVAGAVKGSSMTVTATEGSPLPVKVTNFPAQSGGTPSTTATSTDGSAPPKPQGENTDSSFITDGRAAAAAAEGGFTDGGPGGTFGSGSTDYSSLFSTIGKGAMPYLAAIPGVGPFLAIASQASNISKLVDGFQKKFGNASSSFSPNFNGQSTSYQTNAPATFEDSGGFESSASGAGDAAQETFRASELVAQKADDAAASAVNSVGDSLDSSFSDLASKAGSGGFGISDFFGDLGSSLSDAFSSLGSLFSGGGGGGGLLSFLGGDGGGLADFADLFAFAADGGYISGPGSATSDSIPAMLSNGEFVVKAASTSKYLPLLHAINNDAGHSHLHIPGRTHFAEGGLALASTVGPDNQHGTFGRQPHVTVVQNIHASDINSFRRNQDQLAVDTSRSVNRAIRRNT